MAGRRIRHWGQFTCPTASAAILLSAPAHAQSDTLNVDTVTRLLGALTSEELAALSLTLALVAFAVFAAILYVRTRNELNALRQDAEGKRGDLAARADRAESLLRADRQIIISWHGSQAPEAHVAKGIVPDAPETLDDVLAFDTWLAPDSAALLHSALAQLREKGAPFDLTLKTIGSAHVEADGRAAGGRAVLRIRDITGHRRELAEMRDRHMQATRDAETLRHALDEADVPAWIRDDAGALVWASKGFAQLSGAGSPEDVVSERLEFAPASALAEMSAVRNNRATYRSEIVVSGANAGDANRALVVTEANQRTGSAGLALSPLAISSGAKSEDHGWRADVLNRIDIAVAVFNASGRLAFCNGAYRQLWQLDDALLASAPDFEELLERWRAEDRIPSAPDGMTYREWADGLVDRKECRVRTNDWDLPMSSQSLKLVTVPHSDGSCTHIVHDLTENLDLQTKMRAQTRVQRQTLESLSEAIAVFGQDGKLKLFNPRFASMWDLDAKLLKTNPHIEDIMADCGAVCADPEDWRVLKQNVCGFLDAREPIQRPIERTDGLTIALSTVPLADGATLAVFTDVTAAKSMERALRERNEALEQAAELRSNFVSNVSYHLRDPLQTIIGFAQLLSNTSMSSNPAQQSEYAGYILTSSSSLMAMVNDILDLASIDADVLVLDVETIEIETQVRAAAEALQDRFEEKKVSLDIDIASRATKLDGDARRIRQMLFSLMANAVAHSKDGGTVTVDAAAEGDMIAISVSDTGEGIPADFLDRVFDSFESRQSGGRQRGPGLGLSLAKGFAEKHGGRVEIHSKNGGGTTVTCHLPRIQAVPQTTPSVKMGTAASEKALPNA